MLIVLFCILRSFAVYDVHYIASLITMTQHKPGITAIYIPLWSIIFQISQLYIYFLLPKELSYLLNDCNTVPVTFNVQRHSRSFESKIQNSDDVFELYCTYDITISSKPSLIKRSVIAMFENYATECTLFG